MPPWSVEDNLIFLRNGTDFPARPFIVSALKLFFLFSVGQRGTMVVLEPVCLFAHCHYPISAFYFAYKAAIFVILMKISYQLNASQKPK